MGKMGESSPKGTSDNSSSLAANQNIRPNIMDELSLLGLTKAELIEISKAEDGLGAPEQIDAWYNKQYEIVLLKVKFCLGTVVTAFIGAASIADKSHSIFPAEIETDIAISLGALAGSSGIAAAYYLHRARRVANNSLQVVKMLRRRQGGMT